MADVQWKESMSVGIPQIDAEHKALISMLNDLFLSLRVGKGQDVACETVKSMAMYAVKHFTTEERLFKEHAYPGAEAHIAEHEAFVAEVEDFLDRADCGTCLFTLEIANYLKEWLGKHIMGSDLKYAPYLQA
jgi:hemerythrin-like metal-binding protein